MNTTIISSKPAKIMAIIILKVKKMENKRSIEDEELDEKSFLTIDLNQSSSFMKEFLSHEFPKVTALQLNNIEYLQETQLTTLLDRVIPIGLKQLILCHKLNGKFKMLVREMNSLLEVIENKVVKSITLQGFQFTDVEFNCIVKKSFHLEKISIK
mmetsp:Transcript_1498/g.1308  ORF Transcript_1498/g.1308 Transcript_1498/m.1308 type:complete len:155 (-) Transcript_1498:389-853(-)